MNSTTNPAPQATTDTPDNNEKHGEFAASSSDPRNGKALLKATIPYAKESRAKSWYLVITTFALLFGSLVFAGVIPWEWLRLVFSLFGALLMVRAFITFHDYMHGAILADSRIAKWLFKLFGAFILVPFNSWRRSHNYHHGHVGKPDAVGVGTFPIMTTKTWRASSKGQRLYYRLQRHPLTILFGYITVFAIGICLSPFLKNPVRHIDSLFVFIFHATLVALLWHFGGPDVALFCVLLPMAISGAFGAYLFFAQHNFRQMIISTPETWNYYEAATHSSSYMKLNKVMEWFTGNIGYHHIHHLNVHIPFYRLPEVMAAIPELQSPVVTSLAVRDIRDCFRSSLWDEDLQRVVSYGEAKSVRERLKTPC